MGRAEYLQRNLANKDGYMLVYSQTDKDSLNRLADLVGTIQDLIGKEGERTARKMVSLPPMLYVCEHWNACSPPFFLPSSFLPSFGPRGFCFAQEHISSR